MIDQGGNIRLAFLKELLGRVMKLFVMKGGKLGHVSVDVLALRVKLKPLGRRIENPEIGLGIDPGGRAPLPVAVIDGEVTVNQVASKKAFPFFPVHEQILDQEHRRDHPNAVVHKAGLDELSHAGVDNRITRSSFAPRLELAFVVTPVKSVVFGVEVGIKDMREVKTNGREKIAPNELGEKNISFCFWNSA